MAAHLLKIYSANSNSHIEAITLTQVTVDLTIYGMTVEAHETIGGLIYNNQILSVTGVLIQPHHTDKGLVYGAILTI